MWQYSTFCSKPKVSKNRNFPSPQSPRMSSKTILKKKYSSRHLKKKKKKEERNTSKYHVMVGILEWPLCRIKSHFQKANIQTFPESNLQMNRHYELKKELLPLICFFCQHYWKSVKWSEVHRLHTNVPSISSSFLQHC